ncbi:ABC-F family ATP-binding cassette domain-containing protein [bacterium]|nr:ABC-F family ATP-binding cassette domain-containing protein [bacterium]
MNLLSVESLSKSFGVKTLFHDLSFGIEESQKAALIARNGAGKSTLLRILTGKDSPDTGRIVTRKNISIGYLEQEPAFNENFSIVETLFAASTPALDAIKEYEWALELSEENPSEANRQRLSNAIETMEHERAWDYEYRIKQIITHLRIAHLGQPVAALSGGQRKRLALARVLLEEPDLLILDEPTNHLDLDMIEWLEQYIARPKITLLLVTHDRYFLDRVCDEIFELDRGTLFTYRGNYSYFLEKKSERESVEERELDHTRNILRRELEWMRRQPKARTTKSKARTDAFYELEEKAAGHAPEQKLQLNVKMNRIGGKILELKKITKSYGETVILKGFDYTFKKGERIGIVGGNGVGKTTFLNLLTQQETVDSGKINIGETIVFGYYSQRGLLVNEEKRVIDIVREIADVIPLADGVKVSASQFLNLFQFSPDMQYTSVAKLSGGEKRRLYLLTVLVKNPNFLILDEPTNDLDLLTLNILEEFLSNFEGCLIVVSHDRYFMDKLVDHLFIFEGGGIIKDFNGRYTEYREQIADDEEKIASEKPISSKTSVKTKLSYKEKIEFEKLGKEIEALEIEKKELELQLNRGSSDYKALQGWSERLHVVTELLDQKSTRWLELSEFT